LNPDQQADGERDQSHVVGYHSEDPSERLRR
jgi:hypothetical protein